MLRFDTAIGPCGVAWGPGGITGVSLLPCRAATRPSGAPPPHVRDAIAAVQALLGGEPRDLREVVLDMAAVGDFEQRVYAACRAIDPGHTATYGELARAVGEPGAAQAVGGALGRNPFAPVIPCHRVLAADGRLHGFSAPGGIATKRRMLAIEGAAGFRQTALFA